MSRLSLFWRVVVTNAVVFALGTLVLAVSPATVSFPVAITEVVVLAVGFVVILVTNAVLLRSSFRPLERLVELMGRIDLLRPGQRLAVSGTGEIASVMSSFNEMLDRLEAERRTSSGRALMAQEAERQRIAQELHDEIGQCLTAVVLQLSRAAADAPPELQPELLEARETARASLDELRLVARRLRPGVLDDLGLVRALRELSQTFSSQTGLPVETRLDGGAIALSREAELALYRVTQESLTNAARHSGASRVQLSLRRSGNRAVLSVADDGRGFDEHVDGTGIQGMRERAVLIGGQLTIDSRPGVGTQIRLEVDLSEDA
jgi:two-component system sensor histidine kinase UhpB